MNSSALFMFLESGELLKLSPQTLSEGLEKGMQGVFWAELEFELGLGLGFVRRGDCEHSSSLAIAECV